MAAAVARRRWRGTKGSLLGAGGSGRGALTTATARRRRSRDVGRKETAEKEEEAATDVESMCASGRGSSCQARMSAAVLFTSGNTRMDGRRRRSVVFGGGILAVMTGMKGEASAEDVTQTRSSVVVLDNGMKFEKVATGSDALAAAEPGDTVTFDYVLRRSNGYFVYSTIEGVSFQPRDLPVEPVVSVVGEGALIEGLDAILIGMRPGDRYRVLIPPALAYADVLDNPKKMSPEPPGYAARRQILVHRNEPFLFEIDVVKIKKKNKKATPSKTTAEEGSVPL